MVIPERGCLILDMSEVTRLLEAAKPRGDKSSEELLPLVYAELRRLAAGRMAHEAPGQTLQPTALVHEAWLRLAASENQRCENRAHFFAAAGEAMRRILIECARRKLRLKRGAGAERVDFEEIDIPLPMPGEELLAMNEALDRLAVLNPRAAGLVKLCFFVGMTREDAAREMDVSLSTSERLWAFSRAWLFNEMKSKIGAP